MYNARSSTTALWFLLALFSAVGCKGCDGEPAASAPADAPLKEQQAEEVQLRSRLAARRLDPKKVYPKAADGSVACGTDVDCFVIQGEHCTPAELTHVHKLGDYGFVQRVEAHYKIAGKDAGKCKLVRENLGVTVDINKRWTAVHKQSGTSDEQLEQTKTETLERLREANPPRVECWLTEDKMLEASLDIAENRFDSHLFQTQCNEAEAI